MIWRRKRRGHYWAASLPDRFSAGDLDLILVPGTSGRRVRFQLTIDGKVYDRA
ncbi:hypothetical protein AM571_PC01159 (plasmid) [Rhizobium etli 8C-3]|uniref:Uncharacterized protein n=2 Tax=Rhizobium TaxID=379 RepID=A0A4R3RCE6_9HYPH|nr:MULTISPECIES: hypothetical protein [Rhizobium]APO78892.1 hypothetical protein AM571_PC01159 [Rhizobium etli 8C-3]TCU28866.1 hypothetical protein EV130_10245 [Rhizobium azibense]TCU33875.1 hypothetical protein EV129_114117 [Rhizobium azibense]